MPKIDGTIGPAAWEVIGAKIQSILADELPSQAIKASDNSLDVRVWRERLIPFGKEEIPAVNVSFGRANLDNQDQTSVRIENTFYIDVYTQFKSDSSTNGDDLSAFLLQKLAGVIRGILEHPVYKTLDIDPPFINRRVFSSLIVGKPSSQQDGINTAMGRFEFMVVATDTNLENAPIPLASNEITVKLGTTELGHLFEYPEVS